MLTKQEIINNLKKAIEDMNEIQTTETLNYCTQHKAIHAKNAHDSAVIIDTMNNIINRLEEKEEE